MKKGLKTYEEFIGDKSMDKAIKHSKSVKIASVNTNTPGKEYDDEEDGGDTLNQSPLNGNR
jgi:hypothetical protein